MRYCLGGIGLGAHHFAANTGAWLPDAPGLTTSQGLAWLHVDIAHLVERQTSNLKVGGSNPSIGAKTPTPNYLG